MLICAQVTGTVRTGNNTTREVFIGSPSYRKEKLL